MSTNLLANYQAKTVNTPAINPRVQEQPSVNAAQNNDIAAPITVLNPADTNVSASEAQPAPQAQTQPEQVIKKEIIVRDHFSKNPDRIVNATGVVAGTTGMIGGAILGGVTGIAAVPGTVAKDILKQDYSKILSNSIDPFLEAISKDANLSGLRQEFRTLFSRGVAANNESIIQILKTMSTRLDDAFTGDKNAKAVINKVLDPLLESFSLRTNKKGVFGKIITYLETLAKSDSENASFASYAKIINKRITQLGIKKLFGLPTKTSTIVASVTSNVAKGLKKIMINIENFTPAEREAWEKVSKRMFEELAENPTIKSSKNIGGLLKKMTKNREWLTNPLKAVQKAILEGIKGIDKGLVKLPIKTVGLYSLGGAAICGTLSLLGWAGFKSTLMKKQTKKLQDEEQKIRNS